jgi:transposase-like protein
MSEARPACPKCSHPHVSKNGHVQSVQRWKCRSLNCGYEFTRTTPRGEPAAKQALALLLYSMGRSSYGIMESVKFPGAHRTKLQWFRDERNFQTTQRWQGRSAGR